MGTNQEYQTEQLSAEEEKLIKADMDYELLREQRMNIPGWILYPEVFEK